MVAYHTSYRFPPEDFDVIGRGLRVIGWVGVDLFFALSGFLIGSILLKPEGRSDIAGFFQRRFFRIVPVLFLAVLVFAVADLALHGGHRVSDLWKPLTFMTGYLLPFQGEAAVPFTITWSLSVEVTAYVLMGLAAWSAWGLFPALLLAVVLASPIARTWLAFGYGWDEASIGVFPLVRLDTIALGALAAIGIFSRLTSIPHAHHIYGALSVCLIVGLRFAAWIPPFTSTIGYSIFGLSAALWVASLAKSGRTGGRLSRAAASFGLVSYFIYLFHVFAVEALMIVDRLLGGVFGFWSALIIASLVTYLAALVSWRIFEQPLIAYGHSAPRGFWALRR